MRVSEIRVNQIRVNQGLGVVTKFEENQPQKSAIIKLYEHYEQCFEQCFSLTNCRIINF